MRKYKTISTVLYIVFNAKNEPFIYKYLSKVQNKTGLSSNTLSKHFKKYNTPYKNDDYTIYKCFNTDLKGYYKDNFR
jgi:phospholipase C